MAHCIFKAEFLGSQAKRLVVAPWNMKTQHFLGGNLGDKQSREKEEKEGIFFSLLSFPL